MALTYTPEPHIGLPLPEFQLPSVDGKSYSSRDFYSAKALVVLFICNHCPYVKAVETRLLQLAHDLQTKGAKFVAICSNDPTNYPEDTPEMLFKNWQEKKFPFPYLIDDSQEVAKKFDAVCTPDIYVYDAHQRLAYRGRIDDNWKEPNKVTKQELRLAIENILAGKPVIEQKPSMGCSIKWKHS